MTNGKLTADAARTLLRTLQKVEIRAILIGVRLSDVADQGRLLKLTRVLHALRAQPGLSKTGLAKTLGVSPATAGLLAKELVGTGLVVRAGHDRSTGGRPSERLLLNATEPLSLGVDLGEVDARLGLLDLDGVVVAARQIPFDRDGDRVRLEPILAEVIDLLSSTTAAIAGIGLAVPGLLDPDGGRVRYSANLGWRDVALRDQIASETGLAAVVDRNTNAALLAELWWGSTALAEPALFVTLGSGIGVAIRDGGRFLRGVGGAAGEFGHTVVVDRQGPLCACGQRGCLEALASSRAVQRRCRQLRGDDIADESIAAIVAAARSGDESASQALAEAAGHLADGMVTLVNLFNPSLIMLGGELMAAEAELLPTIRDGVRSRALSESAGQVTIVSSSFRDEAPLIGAATLVFDALFSHRLREPRPT